MLNSFLILVLGAVAGFVLGRELTTRRRTRALEARLEAEQLDLSRVRADLHVARVDRDYYHQRFETTLLDLSRVTQERDQYRDIAASHTVQWPEEPPEPVRQPTPVWRQRRYAHHPSSNLSSLAADLAPHLEAEVRLSLEVLPMGGWESRIRKFGPVEWEGPGHRVLEELRLFLSDDDLRLMRRLQGSGEKVWADIDSPLVFKVDLDIIEHSAPGVHIHEVQVLHMEPVVEERIIEQPVIIEVPVQRLGDQTPEERVTLSREEVLALFEVELERKLAEFGLQRAPDPLGLSMVGQPSDSDRRRRGIAAQRVKKTDS